MDPGLSGGWRRNVFKVIFLLWWLLLTQKSEYNRIFLQSLQDKHKNMLKYVLARLKSEVYYPHFKHYYYIITDFI